MRLWPALFLALTTPALAQSPTQGPPDFGIDTTGTLRNLSVRDATLGSRVPMGAINTTTHTFQPVTRPVNPEMYGAIGNDAIDDTVAVQAALNSGFPVTGLNKSYRISAAGLTMPDGMVLQDITLVRAASTTLATLGNVSGGGQGPFTLRNVKIDYSANLTTAGAANMSFGFEVRTGHDISIDGLEVTGNGKGTAVYIYNTTGIAIQRLFVHDILYTNAVDSLTEEAVGLYLHTTTDSQVSNFRIENIGQSIPWAASTAIPQSSGLQWRTNAGKSYRATNYTAFTTGTTAPTCTTGTCSDGSMTWTYMGAYPAIRRYYQSDGIDLSSVTRASFSNGLIKQVWEGFDAAGFTNDDVYLSNINYADIDAYGEKWGHCVLNGGSVGSHIVRAGATGIIVGSGGSTDNCAPTHLRVADSMSINTGSSGNWPAGSITIAGYKFNLSGAPGTKPMRDVRFINPSAIDDQATHTMAYGFVSEFADPTALVLINPHVAGTISGSNFYSGPNSGMIEVLATDGSTKVTGNLSTTANLAVTGTTAFTGTVAAAARQTNTITSAGALTIPLAIVNAGNTAGTEACLDLVPNSTGVGLRSSQVCATNPNAASNEAGLTLKTAAGGNPGLPRLTITPAGAATFASTIRLTPRTVTTLPACDAASEGTLAAVTDAASVVFNAAAAGGGTNHMLALCNGTGWVIR